jgi:hypothetical protein
MKTALLNLVLKFKPSKLEKLTNFLHQKGEKHATKIGAIVWLFLSIIIGMIGPKDYGFLTNIFSSMAVSLFLVFLLGFIGMIFWGASFAISEKMYIVRQKKIFTFLSQNMSDSTINEMLRKMTLLNMNNLSKEALLNSDSFDHYFNLVNNSIIDNYACDRLSNVIISEEATQQFLSQWQDGVLDKSNAELEIIIKKQMANVLNQEDKTQQKRDDLIAQYSDNPVKIQNSNRQNIFEMKKKLNASL